MKRVQVKNDRNRSKGRGPAKDNQDRLKVSSNRNRSNETCMGEDSWE